MSKKSFIEIVPIFFDGSLGISDKEDYFLIPAKVASEMGYESIILSTPAMDVGKLMQKKHKKVNKDIQIIHIQKWISYLRFLFQYKDAVIFANDRVAKSFIACFFGKHNIFMSHQSRLPKKWWQRKIFLFFVKKFDAIKVSNPFEKEELIKAGVKPERIHYIPLSIDHEFFSKKVSTQRKNEIRKKYNIQKDEKVLLFLAHVRKFKRIDTVLQAMHILREQNIKVKLIIAGKDMLLNEKEKSIQEQAEQLGITEQIVLTESISQERAREIMNISDICVNSSIHEGQGLVVYEASSAGLPLCVSNIGSFTSVFTKSALFHNPDDARKLADNIQYYFKHPQIAKRHVTINKKIIKERCDYNIVTSKLKELFLKV